MTSMTERPGAVGGDTTAVRPFEQFTTAAARGFPGRTVTGVCMIAAPLLAAAASFFGVRFYAGKGTDFVARMSEYPASFNAGTQAILVAVPMLILAVIGLATIVAAGAPRLGRAGGVLAVLGLLGPMFFNGIYWGAWHITDTAAHRTAAAELIENSRVMPGVVVNLSVPCILVGFILLAVAAARSGVLPRWRASCLGLTCLVEVGFISGFLLVSAICFLGTSIALVPLGVRLLKANRHP